MFFSFYDQKTPSWNSELMEINLENTRPQKTIDILKASNHFKPFFEVLTVTLFVKQEIETWLDIAPELQT